MSVLEEKAVEMLDKFEALASQYGPEVINGATSAVVVTGIGDILQGFVALGAAFIVWYLTKNFTKYAKRKKDECGFLSDWEMGWAAGMGIGIFTSGLLAACGIWTLFDVWNWVAIFNPKLALAHRLIGL